jgi:hypothetical protein
VAVIIPLTPGEPEQKLEIALDGVAYVFRVRWNSSDDDGTGAWYLDAWEGDGETPIAFGLKLVLGVEIGQVVNHPLFMGGMFLVDDGEDGIEPGLNDLGGRVQLYHLTTADAMLAEATPP